MSYLARRLFYTTAGRRGPTSAPGSGWPHPIASSATVKDRKSVFLAHASALPARSLLPDFLDHMSALPELKRATHLMYAYRTNLMYPGQAQSSSLPILGQHDGGESGSGDLLARLLEQLRCENTIVVVSRWYGGVKLGSDRWRRISHVAKEALLNGNFIPPKPSPEEVSSKSSKKRRRKSQ